MTMEIKKTDLDDVYLIVPQVIGDSRGWFMETYREDKLEELGLIYDWKQENHSYSAKAGTLRGIHFQNFPMAMAKLVRCTKGKILDIAVDLRPNSKNYKKWVAVELSDENKKQLLIPRGFGHGFVTLTDDCEIQYKVDEFFSQKHDRSIKHNDPIFGIDWKVDNPILSAKDLNAPKLSDSDVNFDVRVLVTGAHGQLGSDVIKLLKEKGIDCKGVGRSDFDITDEKAVNAFVKKYKPTIIIHCAAYIAVDRAEDEREKCYATNVTGTRNIAMAAKSVGAKIVYVSTEGVYGVGGNKLITENDQIKPVNYYAETKLLGEKAVQETTNEHFIIRVGLLFGKHGSNFVTTMLRLGKEKPEINVVTDLVGSPCYTVDLAKFVIELIFTNKFGIYNTANNGFCSRAEYAKEIFNQAHISTNINPIKSTDLNEKAKRQTNGRLNCDKLVENGFTPFPTWQDALRRFLLEIEEIK